MWRAAYAAVILISLGTTSKARVVKSSSTISCPTGVVLQSEAMALGEISSGFSLASSRVRLQRAERLSGECAKLVTQSVRNLYKLKSGVIIGSATGKELTEFDLLPKPIPPIIVNQTQFGVGNKEVKLHALLDVTHLTQGGSQRGLRRYIAIGKQGGNWVVVDVERPLLKEARVSVLATSILPVRHLGYEPHLHGPVGSIVVLQEVAADRLNKINLAWTHGTPGINDLGLSISH